MLFSRPAAIPTTRSKYGGCQTILTSVPNGPYSAKHPLNLQRDATSEWLPLCTSPRVTQVFALLHISCQLLGKTAYPRKNIIYYFSLISSIPIYPKAGSEFQNLDHEFLLLPFHKESVPANFPPFVLQLLKGLKAM